jgi:hypothetical protein
MIPTRHRRPPSAADSLTFLRVLSLVLLAAAASSVHAAQPLATDDAAVVTPKTCQLEVWNRWVNGAQALWAQPACNFTGNLELSVGAARVHTDSAGTSGVVALQAKTVLAASDDGAASFGMLAGAGRATGAPRGRSAFQSYYAKALASWYPRDDLEFDFNLGAANDHGTGTFALAGAAVQYSIARNLQLLAEVFRDEPRGTWYQVGARYIVVPDSFEAYASYGNRLDGSADAWSASIGFRIQTTAFLP